MRWVGREVRLEDSVDAPRAPATSLLREGFMRGTSRATLGLVRVRDGSLVAGPIELLHFGPPQTTADSVTWPIEGGVLAAKPGGRLRLELSAGKLIARVEGYRPALPRSVYEVTQLPLHHAVVRLVLLQLRGRTPSSGVPADVSSRFVAGAIDAGVCGALTLAVARRRRVGAFAAVVAGYHIAAWSVSGRTIGGALMRQRVVSVDGSKLTPVQAMLRLIALPFSAVRLRAIHDEVAATDVVTTAGRIPPR